MRERFLSAAFVDVSEETRLSLLNSQIRYARSRSPFYREHLKDVSPLASLAETAALPLLDAEDIRVHGKGMVCVGGDRVSRIVTLRTTGTAGSSKRLFFTEGDLQRTVDFFAEGMGWMCAAGDSVGICMPCASPDGIGDLLARGLEKLGAVPVRCGMVGAAEDTLAVLRSANCSVLVGLPWQMRLLALVCPELRPKTVLLSADYLPEAMTGFLEERWGCTVLNHFGMTETGYGGAVENALHEGMFLRKDELLAEIIAPESGKPLPFGAVGELVLTTLRREAMPLIRYRTGDLAQMANDGQLLRVLGRAKADRSRYILQEKLCTADWLYDYAPEPREDGISLHLELAPSAPENACEIVAELAEQITGKTVRVTAERGSPASAHMLHPAKRNI